MSKKTSLGSIVCSLNTPKAVTILVLTKKSDLDLRIVTLT